MAIAQEMRIGPERRHWQDEEPKGDCQVCGGQCAPECGRHPAGCIYGGFTDASAYWMVAEGCDLYHGDEGHAQP